MTVPIPTALPAAAGWTLSDWQSISETSAAAGADGTIEIDCDQLDHDVMWLVDRLVVACTSTTQTRLRLYNTTVAAGRLLDQTSAGNLNSADYAQGLLVRPSTLLVAQWTGATVGAVATLTAQVRVYRRNS